MSDRSSGHVGLCLLLAGSGLYLLASYGYALWAAPTATIGTASQWWLAAFGMLVVLAGVFGIVAARSVWNRLPSGRRLGFAFVLAWVLLEALALWGWLEGPRIAPLVVRDPMAPAVRLWIALSIGLFLWGWATEYVGGPSQTETT